MQDSFALTLLFLFSLHDVLRFIFTMFYLYNVLSLLRLNLIMIINTKYKTYFSPQLIPRFPIQPDFYALPAATAFFATSAAVAASSV